MCVRYRRINDLKFSTKSTDVVEDNIGAGLAADMDFVLLFLLHAAAVPRYTGEVANHAWDTDDAMADIPGEGSRNPVENHGVGNLQEVVDS